MLKPPAPTMPGMTDTLDFVKNLWGSMNIPGTGMPGMSGLAGPTLSTDDLDKRIADLKAVESWLNMNITMLRGTIQAMEVQRGTLTALKSMGASMAEAMRQSGVSADKLGSNPFAPFFPMPGAPASAQEPAKSGATSTPPGPAAAASPGSGSGSAQPGVELPIGGDGGAAAAMGMPAAMAWWNLLQDQFRQAVTSAMSSATPPTPDNAAAAPSNAKPAAPAPAPQADAAAGNSGNGKARTSKPRYDKG